jgi:peptide/nickel transport system permease protein
LAFGLFFNDSFTPYEVVLKDAFLTFSKQHLLGTDSLGRDYLSRLFLGTIITVLISLAVQFLATVSGFFIAIIVGFYFQHNFFLFWIDEIVNLVLTIPSILFVLIITASLGKGFCILIISMCIVLWIKSYLIFLKQIRLICSKEYITAFQVLGVKKNILFSRYILNEIKYNLLYIFFVGFIDAILFESGLSFIGLGVQPPIPSLGVLLAEGMNYISIYPHFFIIPGLILLYFSVISSIILIKCRNLSYF